MRHLGSTQHKLNPSEVLKKAEELLVAMRVEEALDLFEQAEAAACDPDACAGGRWECYMLSGDFARAWRESDLISARGNPDPHRYWDGTSIEGKRVLIRCLHGLGDTIQFIRYAPMVRARAQHLTIETQPALKTLAEASRLADRVITWGEPEPEWNQQIEITELPRLFRTEITSIPLGIPYLHAPTTERLPQPADLLRVGIVWNASNFNPARSIPATQLGPLFRVAGARFFSLQAGPERLELAGSLPGLYEEGDSLLRTAEKLQALDLVITVDTMMAHLAGALGLRVWTFLPFRCDWRWMLDREDSPWYPKMKLFRQPGPDNWSPVIERVRLELADLVCSRKPGSCA